MTALVWRGKCLPMRPGKGSFRGVACSPEAKTGPSGAAGNTVDQYRLKPLRREVVRPTRELESESQNGNSRLEPCRGKPFDLWKELDLESQGNPGN